MSNPSPQKDFSLSFEHREKYLYAYVSGERDSYRISKAYWLEIAEYLKTTEYRRVLVDEDITEAASVSDVYQLVSELADMGFARTRIAFFDRKIEHSDLNAFGELVASNRGLNGRVFNDIEKAEAWAAAD